MDEKTASWFAYILSIISAIILLATEKDNKTVRTHAWQSLILGCVFIAAFIIIAILSSIIWGAWMFFLVINNILWVGWLVLTVICIIYAIQGNMFKIPVIYDRVKNMN